MRETGSVLVLLALAFLMNDKQAEAQTQAPELPAHVRSAFHFKLSVPLNRAASLFGPEGERCWAGKHWNPEFIYPQPANDVEGAVFTVKHGPHSSVWVNTRFDLSAGRMQYVSFIPDTVVSVVNVELSVLGPTATGVDVTYTRTALSAASNDLVNELGKKDRTSGPDWQEAIQSCFH
jgi:hypothetical protein